MCRDQRENLSEVFIFGMSCVLGRVSNRNSVAHWVAERNAIFTAISARFVAHIPLPLAPNLRLKVPFLTHQQCGILGARNGLLFP